MNYVIAKIRDKNKIFEKLYAGESIYSLPSGLESAVEYNPSTILEEDEWFKIDDFSQTEYCMDILKEDFRSTDYGEANKVKTQNVEYIISFQDNVYFFQRIFKHSIMEQKRITLGDNVRLDSGEKSIVINNVPDAIFVKTSDVLYFKKLTTVAPIFKGIEELYREATEEETEEFLRNDFIQVASDYDASKIKKSNRKRIAMAMETLQKFSKKEKKIILNYTHDYYPSLQYEAKQGVFTVNNEEEMKYLLWGIEQRYYTTPVTKERRVANSIVEL